MTTSTIHRPQNFDAASSTSSAAAATVADTLSRRYHKASVLLNDAGKYVAALEIRVRALEHAACVSSASAGEEEDVGYDIWSTREDALERARRSSEIVTKAETDVRQSSAQREDDGGARMIGITQHSCPARIGPTPPEEYDNYADDAENPMAESAVIYNLGVSLLNRHCRRISASSNAAIELFELALEAIFIARRRVSRPPHSSASRSESKNHDFKRITRGLDLLEVASLSNLGFVYYWTEQYPSACLAYESAVDSLRRALKKSVRSSSSDVGPDIVARLAECVTNLSRSYDMVGRGADAIAAIREARNLSGEVSGASSSSFLHDKSDGIRNKKGTMAGGMIIATMDELADDQVYVEAHIRHRWGQIGRAMRGYGAYLSRTSSRRRRLISASSSAEKGEGAMSSASAISAAGIDPIVTRDLAARTAAAMHGAASCLLRRSELGEAELGEAQRVALMALTLRERAVAICAGCVIAEAGAGSDPSSRVGRGRARPSRDAADTLYLLGRILRRREEYVDSQEMYVRSAEMRCAVLGHNHPDTLIARCSVAMVLRERNELSASLEACRELLRTERRRLLPSVLRREMRLLEAALLFEMVEDEGKRDDGIASGKDAGGANDVDAKEGAVPGDKPQGQAEAMSGDHAAAEDRIEWSGRCPDAAAA